MSFVTITINHNPQNEPSIVKWEINKGFLSPESERISIEFEGASYSFVLDEDNPRLEVWNIDDKGEVSDMKANISLPKANSPDRA